jgi:hypothetical protein
MHIICSFTETQHIAVVKKPVAKSCSDIKSYRLLKAGPLVRIKLPKGIERAKMRSSESFKIEGLAYATVASLERSTGNENEQYAESGGDEGSD